MIAFILLIIGILCLIGAGIIIAQALSPIRGGFTVGKTITATVAIIGGLALMFVSLGFIEIGPGQTGARTRFGQVQEGTMAPGLHWLFPFVDAAVIYDGRVQAYNFEGIEGATKDLQPVALSGLINYHIDSAKADKILQEIGGPADYAQKVFLRPSNTALKEVTPRYNAADVIGKRDEIGQLTLAALQERMEPFHILVDRVSVENVSLNPNFLASVEAKQIAEQDLQKAAFEADRQIRLAEGERDARITRAEGEAEANRLINQSLTENLLRWTTIQRLADKIKVLMVPSEQGLIFDVGTITTDE